MDSKAFWLEIMRGRLGSLGVHALAEGIIWDPENDPASIVSGSKADAFSGVSSAHTGLKLCQSDIRSLSEVPQRTKLAQSCQHSLERPDFRSERESSADERAGAS